MGLNINYTLLTEGAKDRFALPEYKRVYLSPFYEQSYILEQINDVRQEMANHQYEMLYVFEHVEAFNEGEIWERVSSTVVNIFRTVVNAIRKFYKMVANAISRFIRYIKSKLFPRPKEVTKLRDAEYIDILNKAIIENKPYIPIPNIVPTDKLLDMNFPPAKLICMDKIDYPIRELNYIMAGMSKKDAAGVESDYKDASVIADDLSGIRTLATKELFGDDASKLKNIDDIEGSVEDLQEYLFGPKKVDTAELTIGLYQQAKENLVKSEEMIREMERLQNRIADGYGRAAYSVTRLSRQVEDRLATAHTITIGPFANQSKMLAEITKIAQSCADTINDIMIAHMQLNTYKVQRLAQIYGPASGSAKVQKFCDELVLAQIKKTEPEPKHEDVDMLEDAMEDMNYQIEMARGFLIEATLHDEIYKVIQEADGDNNQQQQTTTTTTTTNNNNQPETKGKIAAFIDRLITAISNAFKKFTLKVEEAIVKIGDKAWWENNKEKISKLNVDNVTVNQWYNFLLDRFKKPSYVKWDETNQAFNTDKDTQTAIFNAIGGSPTIADDASFTEKVKSLYYDKHIDNSTGEGTKFSALGLNRKDMDAFIEDFFNGNNGSILKSIKQELDDINKDAKDVKARFKENMANNKAASTQQQTTTTSTETNTQSGDNNAKQESLIDDSMTYFQYLREAGLTASEKKKLPDSAFGLPDQRRYPMPDEKHVLLAIKFFNHVEPEYEAELAKNIIKKVKEFDMADKVNVGDGNRFKPYWEKSGLAKKKPKKLTETEELFTFDLAGTLGIYNEQTITGLETLEEAEVNADAAKEDNPGISNDAMSQKISRCFKYNTQATGAKMTQAFAAYKQYIGFYKAVMKQLGSGDNKKADNKGNQQQNKEEKK